MILGMLFIFWSFIITTDLHILDQKVQVPTSLLTPSTLASLSYLSPQASLVCYLPLSERATQTDNVQEPCQSITNVEPPNRDRWRKGIFPASWGYPAGTHLQITVLADTPKGQVIISTGFKGSVWPRQEKRKVRGTYNYSLISLKRCWDTRIESNSSLAYIDQAHALPGVHLQLTGLNTPLDEILLLNRATKGLSIIIITIMILFFLIITYLFSLLLLFSLTF